MSSKKRKEAPMPAASAGLMRFFEEETKGIKIRPEIVAIATILVIVISIIAPLFIRV